LFELKGVVVLEKLYEYKDALLDPKLDSDEKIKILNELIEKQPSTEIIQSSKIGKVIRKLAENTSEGIITYLYFQHVNRVVLRPSGPSVKPKLRVRNKNLI